VAMRLIARILLKGKLKQCAPSAKPDEIFELGAS
jgi:hypothetical protein